MPTRYEIRPLESHFLPQNIRLQGAGSRFPSHSTGVIKHYLQRITESPLRLADKPLPTPHVINSSPLHHPWKGDQIRIMPNTKVDLFLGVRVRSSLSFRDVSVSRQALSKNDEWPSVLKCECYIAPSTGNMGSKHNVE
ncbi:hypothetical protein CEXT_381561 [Caerostris extrusa]|uniref:Uncharacterized protein n=1 Tax=Caerostris extrusa TaxID=172846 RepID=A0AAV4WEP5_CAEEX|nr:hypothetical protein CEXT_381561 [Caerostris extrusa]